MSDTPHQSEGDRRAHDGGRVARAWRWFSNGTIRSAERYRDLGWRAVARRTALFIAGLIWSAALARIIALKAFDAVSRR